MQASLTATTKSVTPQSDNPAAKRAIESDGFPFEELSRIAEAESWRKEIYRPSYHIHKWWAQRLGSVFRGILIGALTPVGADTLSLFYSPVRFPDAVVFDPFMGSGTTLGEALKLGGRAIGRDINPVSYLQVHTALTLSNMTALEAAYREVAADVAETISGYYRTRLPDGTTVPVLYYFWVMHTPCPDCAARVDLFSSYIFAKHANPDRRPRVQVVCPRCGAIAPEKHGARVLTCAQCGHCFDAATGPAKGKWAECSHCHCRFAIAQAIRQTGRPPAYRMYAKLILTAEGGKEYHPVNPYDEALYARAVAALRCAPYPLPQEPIMPGYNTDQAINYGFKYWRQLFNARQLLCLSLLANRIQGIEDEALRGALTCHFSGVLEFNNMFASYKGEGSGAVRPMFYHHILKPERMPLEANIWGTPKSSGSFSTLFDSRLLRAARYAQDPFELAGPRGAGSKSSGKVAGISESLLKTANCFSYEQFARGGRLFLTCGDAAETGLPALSVDAVITDPPFFDNVHYSQLADFFHVWQRLILGDFLCPRRETTRSPAEVQNADVKWFTRRLAAALQEAVRVLKDDGILVFTYHHSRWEGWASVLEALTFAKLSITACHPVKAEMSVAIPKSQAKAPINFDIILACRKNRNCAGGTEKTGDLLLGPAVERAKNQIKRLRQAGWQLSRGDAGVVVMAQVIAELSRQSPANMAGKAYGELETSVIKAIDEIHDQGTINAPT